MDEGHGQAEITGLALLLREALADATALARELRAMLPPRPRPMPPVICPVTGDGGEDAAP